MKNSTVITVTSNHDPGIEPYVVSISIVYMCHTLTVLFCVSGFAAIQPGNLNKFDGITDRT